MKEAHRLEELPPYLFAKIDEAKQKALAKGIDIIDLGIGDPDLPTPQRIIKRLSIEAEKAQSHRYPSYKGHIRFREAIARWYADRFEVHPDPKSEVLPLIGSKEGIGHIPLAFINPGDTALIPEPGYPVYRAGVTFAGGLPVIMPLLPENNFLPKLSLIDEEEAKKAKMMFLNYPNNPTSAIAPKSFFEDVVDFARKFDIIVCHDNAYSEISYDGYKAPSFLETEGAKDVGVEFHSLSKTCNMTGWRVGFAVGNKDILSALGKIKTNLDSGIFQAIQFAGLEALQGWQDSLAQIIHIYQERRDILINGLRKLGWKVSPPKATFYIWAPVPGGRTSTEFAEELLEKTGVIITPGVGFGKYGEGFIRISLTTKNERLLQALERIKKFIR